MNKPKRIIHYASFVALVISGFMGLHWVWGIFFIGQTIPALIYRSIFFIDTIYRDEEPVFYWLIFVIWIMFGALMIAMDVPGLQVYLH